MRRDALENWKFMEGRGGVEAEGRAPIEGRVVVVGQQPERRLRDCRAGKCMRTCLVRVVMHVKWAHV